MSDITEILNLAWPVLLFGVFVFFLIEGFRRAVEALFPRIKTDGTLLEALWHDVLLALVLPMMVGGVLAACLATYPYPDSLKSAWKLRFIYGFVVGGFSSNLYRLVRALYNKYVSSKGLDGAEMS